MALFKKELLFVHINKSCGGIVIHNLMRNSERLLVAKFHRTLSDMMKESKKLGLDIHNLTKFTIVRNPFDRMVSMFLFYGRDRKKYKEFFSGNTSIDTDFNKWIEFIYSKKFDRRRRHSKVNVFEHCFSNQLNWLYIDGEIPEELKIYKIEEVSLKTVLEDFGLENVDVNTRVHPTDHDHYSRYYNKESKTLVAIYYSKDIEYFNYEFEYK